ncbi:MAG: hypothetical protein NDJ89_07520 [Oligoflexia bacterium]|nr:hypothetical protein [Oligoflexia bacterium]
MKTTKKFLLRRKLLIFPRFQLLLIGINLAIVALIGGVIWLSVRNTFAELEPVSGLSGMEVAFYQNYLDYQMSSFQSALLLALGAGSAFSVLVTLFVSHRLAGPLLRLRSFFRAIRDGADPVPELSFRDGDYCRDLPPLINDSIERLRSREERRKVS